MGIVLTFQFIVELGEMLVDKSEANRKNRSQRVRLLSILAAACLVGGVIS